MAVRGIVFDDTSFLVFVEDTASHRTMQLRPGDPVAGGRVGQISFDDFGYESAAGAVRKVRIGQNLLGALLPPVVAAPPQPPPTSGPAGGPPGPQSKPGAREPVFEIGPGGQRVRDYVAERSGGE
jgi:hypothetical protein